MKTFSVKNFERFQHYKDRAPPWIKLYNELLDDYDFGALPDASKMHLIAIWLLASRSNNKIPHDPEWIARRINATAKVDLAVLERYGFIVINQEVQNTEQVASEVLADCKQNACLEKRREEGEKEYCTVAKATRTRQTYREDFEEFWKSYPRTPTMSKVEAFKVWQKMPTEDHLLARKAIEPYRQFLRSKPNLETVHACRFLSQRRFEGLAPGAGAAPASDIRSSII